MNSSEQNKILWMKQQWPYIFQNQLDTTNQSLENIFTNINADEIHHEESLQARANSTLCKPTTNKMLNNLLAEHFDLAE